MRNDDKVREMLNEEKIPAELEPENIRKMLEEKAPAKKRSRIKLAGRITAGAAACAVICGGAIRFAGGSDSLKKGESSINDEYEPTSRANGGNSGNNGGSTPLAQTKAPYMRGADSYEEIYAAFKKSYDRQLKNARYYETDDIMEEAEAADENGVSYSGNEAVNAETPKTGGDESYYEARNQEEGVLEADKAKTDGKHIYYVYNEYDENYNAIPKLNYSSAEDGKLGGCGSIDLIPDYASALGAELENVNVNVRETYIYKGKLVVIGSLSGSVRKLDYDKLCDEYGNDPWRYLSKDVSFVSFYTLDDTPQLINTYYQEGRFVDVRIAPDGYMYLLTSYNANYFYYVKDDQYELYVPSAGMEGDCEILAPEDILTPGDSDEEYSYGYTVVGSLDLNPEGKAVPAQTKALAGYTGRLYASANNLYAVVGWGNTSITRISIGGGEILPEASGEVEGRVNDQFSMSEKDGYFRIATTIENYYEYEDGLEYADVEWTPNKGCKVYVLDMDLKVVGESEEFGQTEEIKSVNFQGDIAYVVTFRQTDPLYAIDLGAPEHPVILDEFKLPGFSTYMEKWTDGYLFGIGEAADENYGGILGVKINMFDNSDPTDLKLADSVEILSDDDSKCYSDAVYDRKAVMIAPDKNLIGVQMFVINAGNVREGEGANFTSGYKFYSFEDGKFVFKGEYMSDFESTSDNGSIDRALYIGDNIYVLSGEKFVSLDMDGLTVVDEAQF